MKRKNFTLCILYFMLFCFAAPLRAEEEIADVESYEVEGSLFQRIADLEQEKVLLQLEKEKAQLQLDLDRLAAEQARLLREQENADVRAEEQATEIEKQKLAIELERAKLEASKKKAAEDEKNAAAAAEDAPAKTAPAARNAAAPETEEETLADKYALIEIVGAGSQLFATVENLGTGKQKKLSVGKNLDGYEVRAISIDEGVDLEKDGNVVTLGVGAFALE